MDERWLLLIVAYFLFYRDEEDKYIQIKVLIVVIRYLYTIYKCLTNACTLANMCS